MLTKRGKACLILIFSVNTNCESMAYRSFRSEKHSARGVRKVTTGMPNEPKASFCMDGFFPRRPARTIGDNRLRVAFHYAFSAFRNLLFFSFDSVSYPILTETRKWNYNQDNIHLRERCFRRQITWSRMPNCQCCQGNCMWSDTSLKSITSILRQEAVAWHTYCMYQRVNSVTFIERRSCR